MSDHEGINHGSLYERIVRDLQNGAGDSLTGFLQQFQHPIYAFLRAQGSDHAAAARSLRAFIHEQLNGADAPAGRLRTFLLNGLSRFQEQPCPANNSGAGTVNLDLEWSCNHWEEFAPPGVSAVDAFDHEWAAVILRESRHAVERHYVHHGRAKEYRLLSRSLDAVGRRVSHPELAHMLRIREAQVKQKLLQLRERFRHTLLNHVAETVAESDLAEEISFISERVAQ